MSIQEFQQNIIYKLLYFLIKSVKPEYLALCIENNIYIIQSILWAQKKSAEEIMAELNNYNLTQEQKIALLGELKKFDIVWKTINIIRMVLARFSLDEKITPEKLEELMRQYYPELYEVYISYGEVGKAWLRNEVENDLKPFLRG